MVSPSNSHNQKQNPPSKEQKRDSKSHIRLQKGNKPLAGKTYYLHIKNHAVSNKLEAKIKDLGGAVELFLVKSVTLVVSDTGKSEQTQFDKRKWGYASGGSGGPPSLRSIEIQTPNRTPPTSSLNGECPLSNSTNTRGQTAQRTKSRVDAMLERALTQPQKCSVDPLDNALSWGIPIWTTGNFQIWLDKVYSSLRDINAQCIRRNSTDKDIKVKEFVKTYIKFESFRRETRPVFLELPIWPSLNLNGEPGSCPFDRKKKNEVKVEKKELSESKRDLTRRSRATTRARKSEQLVAGYCEICRIDYRDLSKHVQTDKHLTFVKNNDNFLSLDKLINSGASVEDFLRFNQGNDERDHTLSSAEKLESGIIHNVTTGKTNKPDIIDIDIEELNMVQCNGARRKLNLKLSSPHNLRARTKLVHESGHLLRSKGSARNEVDKSDKFYDKFDGFTIKKRAKGTIWLEEDDPPPAKKCVEGEALPKTKIIEEKTPLSELNDSRSIKKSQLSPKLDEKEGKKEKKYSSENGDKPESLPAKINGDSRLNSEPDERSSRKPPAFNGTVKSLSNSLNSSITKIKKPEVNGGADVAREDSTTHTPKLTEKNRPTRVNDSDVTSKVDEKLKPKFPKRGMRSTRNRPRLSVEERLIEDNRAYYKVEVLGNKLRSSAAHAVHWPEQINPPRKEPDGEDKQPEEDDKKMKKEDEPSSEKPVVVRFKRVRKSELSLLSDEAESFMFGDSRRDDTDCSDDGEGSGSSVVPADTESDPDMRRNSSILSSPINSPIKQELQDEDSQDSYSGRARKRRRTQAEALIKDNTDYYKFETPGSRLRFQGSPTSPRDELSNIAVFHDDKLPPAVCPKNDNSDPKTREKDNRDNRPKSDSAHCEKLYPSKPSAEVEKMRFSFESVPKSEPWYQTYQRQDEGAEYWHFSSESEWRKPFLLPYEIENFHENLLKIYQKNEARKKAKVAKGANGFGRSPRKSPRCHASTLAIMSTIIRRREQQQSQSSSTSVADDDSRSRTGTPKPDKPDKLDKSEKPEKSERTEKTDRSDKAEKSSTDLELQKIVKSIDDMLNAETCPIDDPFEVDVMTTVIEEDTDKVSDFKTPTCLRIPGAPDNLIELLDNCHQHMNGIENSSCASSECGEFAIESPLKRRKRRKNRTGWPGRIRRRLQVKPVITQDADSERENLPDQPRRQGSGEDEEEEEEEEDEEEEDDEEFDQERNTLSKCDRTKLSPIFERPPSKCEQEKTSNDENHENVLRNDNKSPTKLVKTPIKKRREPNRDCRPSSSDTRDSNFEIENDDSFRNKNQSTIISRKNYGTINNGLGSKLKQNEEESKTSDNTETESNNVDSQSDAECTRKECANANSPKKSTIKTRMRQRKTASDSTFDNDGCKKESLESEIELPLSERIRESSPAPQTGEMQQRRSSIEFQPVVRVMKIDDQVDMDHSILAVTVASNRRLRSSSSPRSHTSPPAKRFRKSRGPFSRWMKDS